MLLGREVIFLILLILQLRFIFSKIWSFSCFCWIFKISEKIMCSRWHYWSLGLTFLWRSNWNSVQSFQRLNKQSKHMIIKLELTNWIKIRSELSFTTVPKYRYYNLTAVHHKMWKIQKNLFFLKDLCDICIYLKIRSDLYLLSMVTLIVLYLENSGGKKTRKLCST